jgi:Flp pilus assembly pilin Flp
MTRVNRRKSGQGMVEYIIIVVIIAVAAIAVFGVFGDRIRAMVGGATVELGGDSSKVNDAVSTQGTDYLKEMGKNLSK